MGGLTETLATLATDGVAPRNDAWIAHIAEVERSKRGAEREQLTNDPRAFSDPLRVYKELDDVLDRDAIIVGDGGDFVRDAGRVINSYEPGCWLDPGPYGCRGSRPGYALAAKLAHPDRQVILLLGDGAFGFSGMEFDTLARHDVDVVGVMGNNGIWALEHHPIDVPLRLLGGGQAAARDAVRPGGRGARRPRRARAHAGGSGAPRSNGRCRRASRRSSTCSPTLRSRTRARPTWPSREPAQTGRWPHANKLLMQETADIMSAASQVAPSGRAGVRAMKGPGSAVRAAGGADSMRLRPNL